MALQIERVLDSFFEFSLNGGTPIVDSSPSLTIRGNICNFKTKNGASIIKEQNIPVSDVTVVDTFGGGGSFTYNNGVSLIEKLDTLNFFQDRITPSAGATSFKTLSDTFSFFGHDGKVPVVNEEQDKLEPTVFHNISLLTSLLDVSIDELIDGKVLGVKSINDKLKFTLVDGGTGTGTGTTPKRIEVIAEAGQTQIRIDSKPQDIFLYKNGSWQIQRDGYDFTYDSATGIVTLLYVAKENDYYEAIFLDGSMRKYEVLATSNNQTEFNYDGNPAFVDAYLEGSKLREGVDYNRTKLSENNKITIINQDLIDTIKIGYLIEIITY